VNPAASSKRPRKGEKEEPSPESLDEGYGRCEELGGSIEEPLGVMGAVW